MMASRYREPVKSSNLCRARARTRARSKNYAYQHWKAHRQERSARTVGWRGFGKVLVARHDAQIEVEARHLVEEERNVFGRARPYAYQNWKAHLSGALGCGSSHFAMSEGCVGSAGAEPHAQGTSHAAKYQGLCRT